MARKRLLRCSCYSLLLFGMAAQAGAQAPDQWARFHRQFVEGPRRNGWVQAQSTEGHYSLEIPCAYNDSTASPENGPSRGHDLAYVVACDRPDGVRFFAVRIEYPGGGPAAEEKFRSRFSGHAFATGLMADGRVGDRPYVDSNLDRPGLCAYARMLRAGDDLLLMLVEPVNAPNARCGALQADADRFRRSIRVQQ